MHQGPTGGSAPRETDTAGTRLYLVESDADTRAHLRHLLAAEFMVEAFAGGHAAGQPANIKNPQSAPHLEEVYFAAPRQTIGP